MESAISEKETLREKIKSRLRTIPGEAFCLHGTKAAALLRTSPIWSRYKTVFLFLSMNCEIDTQPLLEAALKEEKKVFAPRVLSGNLVFCRISSAEGPWSKGPFGLREPVSGNGEPADFPALVLVPGIAFDNTGNRLGRGAAYYDRFFAELDKDRKEYFALGLCMDFQMARSVPVETHDKKMDGILTGTALYVP